MMPDNYDWTYDYVLLKSAWGTDYGTYYRTKMILACKSKDLYHGRMPFAIQSYFCYFVWQKSVTQISFVAELPWVYDQFWFL